jgi:hypothetical protein
MFTHIPVKQEQFLFLVVEGMTATAAYAKVYGEDKSRAVCEAAASRVLSSVKVKARRQEMLAAKAAATPITVEYLTREALATVQEARALGQGSAALQGYQLVAKLHGLLIDRQQTDVLIRKPSSSPESPDDLSAEDWLTEYASTKLITENTVTVEPSDDEGSKP